MHSHFLVSLRRRGHSLLVAALVLGLPGMALSQVVYESEDLEEEVEEIRRYTVELIVFEYTESAVSGNEIFLPDEIPADEELGPMQPRYFGDPGTRIDPGAPVAIDATAIPDEDPLDFLLSEEPEEPAAEQVLEEFPSHILHTQLKVLDPEEHAMKDIYKKLTELDAYEPVMRAAWTQATFEKDLTLPIKLRRLGNAPLRLDGSLTLYLSRYLHLVVDLTMETQQTGSGARNNYGDRYYRDRRSSRNYRYGYEQEPTSIKFSISEDRIFRNGELRYYDHPRFGVLARITRYEEPELETDEMYLLPAEPDVSGQR